MTAVSRWARAPRLARLLAGAAAAAILASRCGVNTGREAPTPAPPPAAQPGATKAAPEAPRLTTWHPLLGPPHARSGRAVWAATPDSLPYDPVETVRRAFTPARKGAVDSVAAWKLAAQSSTLRAAALRRLGPLLLARGDTAAADRCWRTLGRERSPWTWEAARSLSALAAATRGALAGDSILAAFERQAWPDSERAAWLVRRASLRATAGDMNVALDFSRQAMRRYPNAEATPDAVNLLAALLGRRGATFTAHDERDAAEVDMARGDRSSAAKRLARAERLWTEADRWLVALRLSEVQRAARQFPAARTAAAAALHRAPGAPDSARCLLERARIERDAGAVEQAFMYYMKAARRSEEPTVTETAYWEKAREEETRDLWARAEADFQRVEVVRAERAEDAAFKAGLMSWIQNHRDDAMRHWEVSSGEGALFWRAAGLRASDPSAADSILRKIAAAPGYTFYRVAARETLGVRGWRGKVLAERGPGDAADSTTFATARALAAIGAREEATQILERWASGDPRTRAGGDRERATSTTLEAARIAFGLGRPALGVRLAQQAWDASGSGSAAAERQWGVGPWLYPPAFDSLFRAYPDSGAAPDGALLRAVSWQESKFDPDARSRSNAVGLMQLKLSTAADVARMLGEKAPSDSALRDPATSLRWGARYLDYQLSRYERDVPLALEAYNRGRADAARWAKLRARGGDALACEEIIYPEAEGYVKRILGARQAYRELRPALTVGD